MCIILYNGNPKPLPNTLGSQQAVTINDVHDTIVLFYKQAAFASANRTPGNISSDLYGLCLTKITTVH